MRSQVLTLLGDAARVDLATLREIREELQRFDAIGPITDPTQYVHTADVRELNRRILDTVIPFIARVQEEFGRDPGGDAA